MGTRVELQEELKSLLGTSEEKGNAARCYFQPPESIKMSYPCFVYSRERSDIIDADNLIYRRVHRYSLTYLTYDPDDPLIDGVEEHFRFCRFVRHNKANNLNHYHYDLYY